MSVHLTFSPTSLVSDLFWIYVKWEIVARIPFLYIAVNAEKRLTSLLMLIGFSKAGLLFFYVCFLF